MAAVIGRTSQKMMGLGDHGGGEIYYNDRSRNNGCLQSPFAAYYIVTISLNSVCILAGIFSQVNFHQRYQHSYNNTMDTWYMFNGLFGVLHILGAIYIVKQISRGGGGENNDNHNVYHQYPPSGGTPTQNAEVVSVTAKTTENEQYIPEAIPVTTGLEQQQQQQKSFMAPPSSTNKKKKKGWFTTSKQQEKQQEQQYLPQHQLQKQYPPQQQQHQQKYHMSNPSSSTKPLTLSRVKHVLCEDRIVAVYIVVFVFYVAWHFFLNEQYLARNSYNYGVRFVTKCADVYVMAGPASFVFSIIVMKMKEQ